MEGNALTPLVDWDCVGLLLSAFFPLVGLGPILGLVLTVLGRRTVEYHAD